MGPVLLGPMYGAALIEWIVFVPMGNRFSILSIHAQTVIGQPGPARPRAQAWGLFSGAQGKTRVKPQPRPWAMFLGPSPLGPCGRISKGSFPLDSAPARPRPSLGPAQAQGETTVTRSNRSGFVYHPPYHSLESGFPYQASPWFPVGTPVSPW